MVQYRRGEDGELEAVPDALPPLPPGLNYAPRYPFGKPRPLRRAFATMWRCTVALANVSAVVLICFSVYRHGPRLLGLTEPPVDYVAPVFHCTGPASCPPSPPPSRPQRQRSKPSHIT